MAGTPIEASGTIIVSDADVAVVPPIAYSIPDFEGTAILRIFANSTQSQIGCFAATLGNGITFSHPEYVGTVIGFFTLVAIIASFAAAVYGDTVSEIRKHYAHSVSVLVVFAVWHHIYFTGALSMNWPSVLVAFWKNYAWTAGMIYSKNMQDSINNFVGANKGNTTAVGAAGVGTSDPTLGGGYDINLIYWKRAMDHAINPGNTVARMAKNALAKRDSSNSSDGYLWAGDLVVPGLPLPGNYSGFAGTLAPVKIPASNAFMTGFLWFLVVLAALLATMLLLKFGLAALIKVKVVKRDRLAFYKRHWVWYLAVGVLRTFTIGFFFLVFLALFQFAYLASSGPVAVACVIFLLLLLGLGSLAGYACFYRIKFGNYVSEPDRLNIERTKQLKFLPWYRFTSNRRFPRSEDKIYAGSLPWWSVRSVSEEKSIHHDDDFTMKFGWLASRFRRTRWWFFVCWLVYEFVRACFLAGAATKPLVQVYGLLAVELIAFIALIILRPFEGRRLNWLVVYVLGFSKVVTTGLSAALANSYNLERIPATVVGIVIIVIHGILTFITFIAIVTGAVSTYLSVMRNRERLHPSRWIPTREKYFNHMDKAEKDLPPTPKETSKPSEPPKPTGPYFNVNSIKRLPKVEDEDPEFLAEITGELDRVSMYQGESSGDLGPQRSRAPSVRSQMSYSSLPYGARVHRASWSSRDFTAENWGPAAAPYPMERRRSRGNSLTYLQNAEDRPSSRSLSRTHTRLPSSSDTDIRPLSANAASPGVLSPGTSLTVLSPPVLSPRVSPPMHADIPAPPPHRRSTSLNVNRRPPLETLPSENQITPLQLPKQ